MRKIMYIWICVLLVFLPVHVSASFVVEEEVEVSSGDINGNQQPQSVPEEPAQQQPQIQTEPSPSTYTSGNRPNSTVSPKKPEVTEQKKEQESTDNTDNTETENISIEETEMVVPETENVEQPVTEAMETETAVPETETHEPLETEMAATEENVSDTETAKERSNDNNENIAKADLQRAVGMLCILIAVAGGIYLFYGQVKLYNLSSDHKYSYIGMCRISVKRDCVQIHMSKFLMNRGRSGEYKIVVNNRILKRRSGKMCVLLLPEHERIEAGVLRKEILFQYE